jgi:hypothetical protein
MLARRRSPNGCFKGLFLGNTMEHGRFEYSPIARRRTPSPFGSRPTHGENKLLFTDMLCADGRHLSVAVQFCNFRS